MCTAQPNEPWYIKHSCHQVTEHATAMAVIVLLLYFTPKSVSWYLFQDAPHTLLAMILASFLPNTW